MEYIIYYLVTMNFIALLLMFIDKKKAIKNKWRISESTLIMFSIFGGSVGTLIGMKLFRHKSKKNKFKIGIPFIIILQLVAVLYFI